MFYKLFSQENTPYFVVVFGVLIVILIIFLFVKQFMFERKITTKTINIVTRIETDATTEEECIKMTIANTGFHSVEIRGFGFKHKNRDYDYLKTYKEERNINYAQKIVISPRDSLETVINLKELKAKLNTTKIGKFKSYVIDVYGNYCLIKAKDVKKFIELYFKHVEYIEKIKNMPAEKQEKYLAKEKAFEERKKKILNNTIEDSFEKANIDAKEETQVPTFAKPAEEIKEEKVVEETLVEESPVVEENIEAEELEDYTAKNEDFFFNDVNVDEESEEEKEK